MLTPGNNHSFVVVEGASGGNHRSLQWLFHLALCLLARHDRRIDGSRTVALHGAAGYKGKPYIRRAACLGKGRRRPTPGRSVERLLTLVTSDDSLSRIRVMYDAGAFRTDAWEMTPSLADQKSSPQTVLTIKIRLTGRPVGLPEVVVFDQSSEHRLSPYARRYTTRRRCPGTQVQGAPHRPPPRRSHTTSMTSTWAVVWDPRLAADGWSGC
jgi:hypothetical protein